MKTDEKNKKAKNRRRIIDDEYENDIAKNTESSKWIWICRKSFQTLLFFKSLCIESMDIVNIFKIIPIL